jgi:hypothetical protein
VKCPNCEEEMNLVNPTMFGAVEGDLFFDCRKCDIMIDKE